MLLVAVGTFRTGWAIAGGFWWAGGSGRGAGWVHGGKDQFEHAHHGLHLIRGSTRKNAIFSNSLWTNSEYPNSLKSMSI
jgi:hypothetical protein